MPTPRLVLLQTSGVESWGDAVRGAFADSMSMLLGGIPKVVGFLLILLIGWFIAGVISRLVARVLRTARFEEVGERSGFNGMASRLGFTDGAVDLVALFIKWFIRLIVLVAAFDALGIPEISRLFQDFLVWLPNLIVALVIVIFAGLVANLVGRLVRGAVSSSGLGDPDLLAAIARFAVWAFAVVLISNQLGIAETAVNTLFTAVVGAAALAIGLAFGLGGRDTAGEIVQGWYRRYRELASGDQTSQPGD